MRVQAIKLGDNHQEITETSQKSTQKNYQTSTASLAEYPVKPGLSQVKEVDFQTIEGICGGTLSASWKRKNLPTSLQKMLKDS